MVTTRVLKLITTIAVVAFTCSTTACAAEEETIYGELSHLINTQEPASNNIEKLIRVGRYERAVSQLNSNASADHNQVAFTQEIASCYLLGEYEKVRALCEKWLSDNPAAQPSEASLVFELVGTCDYNSGDFERAITAFTKAIQLSPHASAYVARAKAHEKLKEEKLASDDYAHGQVTSPTGTVGRSNTIAENLQLYLVQTAGAPAIEIKPSASYPGTGDLKSWKQAAQLAQQAAELEANGEFGKATALYRRATDIYSLDSGLWAALGLCAMTDVLNDSACQDEDLKPAEQAFSKALSLSQTDWRLWNDSAVLEYLASDTDSAKDKFEKVLQDKGVPKYQQYAIRGALQICAQMPKLEQQLIDQERK